MHLRVACFFLKQSQRAKLRPFENQSVNISVDMSVICSVLTLPPLSQEAKQEEHGPAQSELRTAPTVAAISALVVQSFASQVILRPPTHYLRFHILVCSVPVTQKLVGCRSK